MRNRKTLYYLLPVVLGLLWVCYSQVRLTAQEGPEYVGTEVCATCHADVFKTWQFTTHRQTLFNTDPSKKGCEACHGPGEDHVAGGGDPTKIIRLIRLKPNESAEICQKCHTQEETTLWHTSAHARAKLTCMNCHDVHAVGEKSKLTDIDNGKQKVEGLGRAIKQTELEAAIAEKGSAEKAAASERVQELRIERSALEAQLKGEESEFDRTAEPYVCFNCHKDKEVQSKMPSHHPLQEGKVTCSSCHNPHGGPNGLLRQESVPETCFRCHADKIGPFTFEHPPVTEDCTICHNPHGSVQNNLLVQNQPFLCMKCHSGPHSRSGTFGDPSQIPNYYTECTDCHSQVHGSDEHSALHF
ncbi:MAG TPA: cytochrome c3 family protein [Armatimonadota bacterium]|nr:cytochrome c3 family protein [Armatimonadota bacterium]